MPSLNRLEVGSMIRGADGKLKIVTVLNNQEIRYRELNRFERVLRWLALKLTGQKEPLPLSRQQQRAAVQQSIKSIRSNLKRRRRVFRLYSRRSSGTTLRHGPH